jgi:hypothetical protein
MIQKNKNAVSASQMLKNKKKSKYVILFSSSGELISIQATKESDVHRDSVNHTISFTDLKGKHMEWSGTYLLTDKRIRVKTKPKVINR